MGWDGMADSVYSFCFLGVGTDVETGYRCSFDMMLSDWRLVLVSSCAEIECGRREILEKDEVMGERRK
jgi:hypothetical protein